MSASPLMCVDRSRAVKSKVLCRLRAFCERRRGAAADAEDGAGDAQMARNRNIAVISRVARCDALLFTSSLASGREIYNFKEL